MQCRNCTKSKHEDLHPHFECIECGKINCLNTEVIIPKIQNHDFIISNLNSGFM